MKIQYQLLRKKRNGVRNVGRVGFVMIVMGLVLVIMRQYLSIYLFFALPAMVQENVLSATVEGLS